MHDDDHFWAVSDDIEHFQGHGRIVFFKFFDVNVTAFVFHVYLFVTDPSNGLIGSFCDDQNLCGTDNSVCSGGSGGCVCSEDYQTHTDYSCSEYNYYTMWKNVKTPFEECDHTRNNSSSRKFRAGLPGGRGGSIGRASASRSATSATIVFI